jgi:hypothetical protein
MQILISWGTTQPNQALVDLMLEKIRSYHFTRGAKFVFDYCWKKEGEEPASYDAQCWHIRDETEAPCGHRGVDACRDMLEGLNAGFALAQKLNPPPAKKVRTTKRVVSEPAFA